MSWSSSSTKTSFSTPIGGLEGLGFGQRRAANSSRSPATIAPGFVQRHVAYPSTALEQPPGHAMALHFALIGTLSLAIGRTGKGVLIVPDVVDLRDFIRRRPLLNPREARDCQIASPADAALQATSSAPSGGSRFRLQGGPMRRGPFFLHDVEPKPEGASAVLDVDPRGSELDVYERVMAIPSLKSRYRRGQTREEGRPATQVLGGGNRPRPDRRESRPPRTLVPRFPKPRRRVGREDGRAEGLAAQVRTGGFARDD